MTEDSLPFDLPAVQRKNMIADIGGGSIPSDGGLVRLCAAERRLGLAEALAGWIREWRDPAQTVHTLPTMLRFPMFAIACGYEEADHSDALREDPLFKLAVGRAPGSARDLYDSIKRVSHGIPKIDIAVRPASTDFSSVATKCFRHNSPARRANARCILFRCSASHRC